MLRTVFMGSPAFAATILSRYVEKLPPPLLVVTQPARPAGRGRQLEPTAVEVLAKQFNLPLIAPPNVNEPEVIATIASHRPDIILVAAFGQILRDATLAIPRLFCLNAHASLLPKYRGAAPIQRAIWNGEAVTGITIQKMVKKLDAGDILLSRDLAIGPNETSGELTERLANLAAYCMVEAVEMVESGNYAFTPQEEGQVTVAKKIERDEAKIDWSKPAARVACQVRALQPWPIAETGLGGEIFKIHRVRVATHHGALEDPGTVDTDGKTFMRVVCGGGSTLDLLEVQAANRRKMPVADYLRGFQGKFPFSRFEGVTK